MDICSEYRIAQTIMIKILSTIVILLLVLCTQVNTVGRQVAWRENLARTIDYSMKLEVYNQLNLDAEARELPENQALIHELLARKYHEKLKYIDAALEFKTSAKIYKNLGNQNKFIELCTLAISLLEQIPICYSFSKRYMNTAQRYIEIADISSEIDNISKANQYYALAARFFEQMAIEDEKQGQDRAAWNYRRSGDCYTKIANLVKAIETLCNAAVLFEQQSIKIRSNGYLNGEFECRNAADCCKLAADCCKRIGDKPEANRLYIKAADLYNSYGNDTAAMEMRFNADDSTITSEITETN